MLLYVSRAGREIDERTFTMIRRLRATGDKTLSLQAFKNLAREQALMLKLDQEAAIKAMPKLLSGSTATQIRETHEMMKAVLEAAQPLSPGALTSLKEMELIFGQAQKRAQVKEAPRPDKTRLYASKARVKRAVATPRVHRRNPSARGLLQSLSQALRPNREQSVAKS